MISASLVKELREKTGAGMLDCKKALEATNGSIEEAVDWLREKGISKAAKKADRIAAEGVAAILTEGNNAVILEMNSETDFVAKNNEFQELVSEALKTIIKSDAKTLDDVLNLPYENGTIDQSLNYMNSKYDFYIVRNMHQLFLQITNEGARDSGESLENMSQDIDMLVEGVYRDRIDRASFHKKFLQFGIILYLMVMLVQFMLGMETYNQMLNDWWVQVLLHGIIWLNTFFILSGEKYYNEDVGAE